MMFLFRLPALITILIVVGVNAKASDSLNGSLRFKIEVPKNEPQVISLARYVSDAAQNLTASCPVDTKIVAVACNGDTRLFGSNAVVGGLPFAISNDLAFRTIFTETSVSSGPVSTAKCNAVAVRPDEFVKLSMTIKCLKDDAVIEAKK